MENFDDLKYVPGIFDRFKQQDRLERWTDFPDLMRSLGYEMDCCKSFNAYREQSKLRLKKADSERQEKRNILYLLEHAERQIVGNYLFSQWRYYTHWADSYNEYDVDFLKRIIVILETAYEQESAGQDFKEEPIHSGFEAPAYGIVIPKEYTFETDKDGISYLIPPEGSEVPKELKPYCRMKSSAIEEEKLQTEDTTEKTADEMPEASDKFAWKKGDLNVVKLVYKGKVIYDHTDDEADEEYDDYDEDDEYNDSVDDHLEEILDELQSKMNTDLSSSKECDRKYEVDSMIPVQSFVANISFPKSLDELTEDFMETKERYDTETVLQENPGGWTAPKWAKEDDIVFFMHAAYAHQKINALRTELQKNDYLYSESEIKRIDRWLDRGKRIHKMYGGKIFAVARVVKSPEVFQETVLSHAHWRSNIYADITDRWILDHPVDISEFRDFIQISRQGSITPVYGSAYEKLKELILAKNSGAPEYFLRSFAAPIPLAKIDSSNWLSVTYDYRRRFVLEEQFRTFYVNYFLQNLGDRKTIYRECRCKKEGIPDSFVDNIILFNGRYLPVEVKLNIKNEIDLPGQARKYCNDDIRYADHGTEKPIDNMKSYQNCVLIIDTENVYLYDDRTGKIDQIKNLDEIREVEDIRALKTKLTEMIKS